MDKNYHSDLPTNWEKVRQAVFDNIHQPSVFEETLGFFDKKKKFINPFRPSKSADSSFYLNEKTGTWLFHDFVSGEHYDIIECVKLVYSLNFREALIYLANTYGIKNRLAENGFIVPNDYQSQRIKGGSDLFLKMLKAQKKEKEEQKEQEKIKDKNYYNCYWDQQDSSILLCGEYQIVTMSDNCWDHNTFWYQRGMMWPDNCYAVQEFIAPSGKLIFRDNPGMPMFVFIGVGGCQIYRPFADKKTKFRNIGSAVFINFAKRNYQYPIQCKSFKEFYLLTDMGFSAFGKSGEATVFPLDDWNLTNRKSLVIACDADDKGIEASDRMIEKYKKKGVKAIGINMSRLGLKDIDDAVVKYGLLITKKYIKHLIKSKIKEIKNEKAI